MVSSLWLFRFEGTQVWFLVFSNLVNISNKILSQTSIFLRDLPSTLQINRALQNFDRERWHLQPLVDHDNGYCQIPQSNSPWLSNLNPWLHNSLQTFRMNYYNEQDLHRLYKSRVKWCEEISYLLSMITVIDEMNLACSFLFW